MSSISRLKDAANTLGDKAKQAVESVKQRVEENKDQWRKIAEDVVTVGAETAEAAAASAAEAATNLYRNMRYSKAALHDLQNQIENQGGHYRELARATRQTDTLVIGGESLVVLLASGAIPIEIEEAYRMAYPDLAETVSFEDKVRALSGEELQGLINGVKGKLFEQKYVEYLNKGNLPEGYSASLAGSAIQPGWDIQIHGPNNEIASVLQAKATDSVSYVTDALERYPNIDVVTTDEVYSHLVLSGISENLAKGYVTNAELADQLDRAVDSAELSFDFSPPVITLAFIAFTSYKNDSLLLYEKARSAGDRSGKAYLSYLVGGGIATITNTWWLGVLGSVASRYLSDKGLKKAELFDRLKQTYETNQTIIDRLKRVKAAQQTVPGDGLASLGRA